MKRICLHCKAEVQYFPVAPDGRRIPVNFRPDSFGQLMFDPLTGWLVKAYETNQERERYRSHLLDCKASAKALHFSRNIPVVKKDEACAFPGCKFTGIHSHATCDRCGEAGHYANVCEADEVVPELEFG